MKKVIIVLTALVLTVLALCACASPQKVAQNIIKQQTGQNVEINNDGSSITIKGQDGDSVTVDAGDNLKWPTGKVGNLPELKGKMKSVVSSGGGYYLTLEDVSKADAEAYIQKLKSLGYADGGETEDESGYKMFSGSGSGYEVMFSYYPEGGSGAGMSSVDIWYMPKQKSEE